MGSVAAGGQRVDSRVRDHGRAVGDREGVNEVDASDAATWSAGAFRAITGDGLLRFFAVFQTAGMLG